MDSEFPMYGLDTRYIVKKPQRHVPYLMGLPAKWRKKTQKQLLIYSCCKHHKAEVLDTGRASLGY
jgi:hypothetical protein